MVDDNNKDREDGEFSGSVLDGPAVNPAFRKALDELVAVARQGQRRGSEFFNVNRHSGRKNRYKNWRTHYLTPKESLNGLLR